MHFKNLQMLFALNKVNEGRIFFFDQFKNIVGLSPFKFTIIKNKVKKNLTYMYVTSSKILKYKKRRLEEIFITFVVNFKKNYINKKSEVNL